MLNWTQAPIPKMGEVVLYPNPIPADKRFMVRFGNETHWQAVARGFLYLHEVNFSQLKGRKWSMCTATKCYICPQEWLIEK